MQGELFGKERAKALVSKDVSLSARQIADKILEEIELFSDFHSPNVDIARQLLELMKKIIELILQSLRSVSPHIVRCQI